MWFNCCCRQKHSLTYLRQKLIITLCKTKKKLYIHVQRGKGIHRIKIFLKCVHMIKSHVSQKKIHTHKKKSLKKIAVCHASCLYTELWSPIIYNDNCPFV